MAYKRNYKREYETALLRGEDKGNIERKQAQRLYDKMGIERDGKDIDHVKRIKDGGKTTKGNLRLRSVKANRGDNQ